MPGLLFNNNAPSILLDGVLFFVQTEIDKPLYSLILII
jgi:hypothetical protein